MNHSTSRPLTSLQTNFVPWITRFRDSICQSFVELEREWSPESKTQFEQKPWKRSDTNDQGGGVMSIMYGQVFEKVGVNISTVYGEFGPEFRKSIKGAEDDPRFWASGISLVAHMMNPYVPSFHMNLRHIVTTRQWFGGGIDLTPTIEFQEDTEHFHNSLKHTCDSYHPDYYQKFKTWCDDYFFLPHRGEPRGVGGIFFDYLEHQLEQDWRFVQSTGDTFLEIIPHLIRSRMFTPWNVKDKMRQWHKRSRYVEFNLLYDRGTQFGLKTGGNVEAILMSLPPMATWLDSPVGSAQIEQHLVNLLQMVHSQDEQVNKD